jgi:hypothetical protein
MGEPAWSAYSAVVTQWDGHLQSGSRVRVPSHRVPLELTTVCRLSPFGRAALSPLSPQPQVQSGALKPRSRGFSFGRSHEENEEVGGISDRSTFIFDLFAFLADFLAAFFSAFSAIFNNLFFLGIHRSIPVRPTKPPALASGANFTSQKLR